MAGAKLESPRQPATAKTKDAPRRDGPPPERQRTPLPLPHAFAEPPLGAPPWRAPRGQPLSPELRMRLAPAMGERAPLSARVHTGSYAELITQAWDARAVTLGEDIFFARGEYRPGTVVGDLLIAHEVAHVEQMQQGLLRRPATKKKGGGGGEEVEARADAKAQAAVTQPSSTDTRPAPGAAVPTEASLGSAAPSAASLNPANSIPATSNAAAPAAVAAPSGQETPAADAAAKVPKDAAGTNAPAPGVGGTPAAGGAQEGDGSPASPETDPGFQSVKAKVAAAARHEEEHDPSKTKAAEAQAAAAPPENEVEAKAGARQVDVIAAEKPKPFSKEAFKQALLVQIKSIAPTNLDEAEKFKKNNPVAGLRGDMQQKVQQGKEEAQGGLKEKTEQAPDPSGIQPKQVTALPPTAPGAEPGSVQAGNAAPKPKSDTEVQAKLAEPAKELDQKMADADVTDEQLDRSNESTFQKGLESKNTAKEDAAKAPGEYRQAENQQLAKARGQAEGEAQKQLGGMHDERTNQFTEVVGQQDKSKSKNEKEQSQFAQTLTAIYQKTKQKVEDRLKRLDDEANKAFDDGAAAAQASFLDYIDSQVFQYKLDRYLSRLDGPVLWLRDLFKGLPPEVNQIYEAGKNKFIRDMEAVIDRVATIVETGLNDALAEVNRGKDEVQKEFQRLGRELTEAEKQAVGDIQGQFDDLAQSVADKQLELIEGLAQKYQQQLDKVNSTIKERQKENRGLVDKAFDLINDILETIKKLKDLLLSVLARVGGLISKIIKDPIGFLGNLVAGAKAGFLQFLDHIGTHLLNGLMGWLLGALGSAGIDLSGFTLDAKGILRLVLQVLGLTYTNIRARAVQIVGEPVVKALETASEIIMVLIKEGPAGLWQYIKDMVGDLKTIVLEGIKDFVISKIITAGVTWVLSLLNPASAFIKACKLIYDVVTFFIERASQIAALVNAVLDTLEAVVDGNIGAMAAKIEAALAKAVPVVISFMAAVLGITGISDKIKKIIEKIRAPIDKAIDWVIHKAVDLVKKAGKFVKGPFKGKGKTDPDSTKNGKDKTEEQKQEDQEKLSKAVAAIRPQVEAMITKGTSKLLLKAKLLYWRVRYGLTRLELKEIDRTTFRVIAVVNPEEDVGFGVVMDAEDLLLYVREVATEIENMPAVSEGARRILDSKTTEEKQRTGKGSPSLIEHYTVSEHESLPAAYLAAKQMDHRGLGRAERLHFTGERETQVMRQQWWGGTENKVVKSVIDGKVDKGLDYPEIAESLAGHDPRKVGLALQTWAVHRTVPKGFDPNVIAGLSALMFVQETHRNPATLATAPMVVDLLRSGIQTPSGKPYTTKEALVGMFPMAVEGAGKESKALKQHLAARRQAQQAGTALPEATGHAKAGLERELALIKAWIQTLNLTFRDKASMEEKVKELRKRIRERLLEFYGLPTT